MSREEQADQVGLGLIRSQRIRSPAAKQALDIGHPSKWARTARRRQGNEPALTGESLVDTKLTAALACAAALAFGACSGGNPPASVAPENEMTDPETAETETAETETPDPGTGVPEPAEPVEDGRTEAELFDDELAEAEADLAAARSRVAAAVAAAGIAAGRRRKNRPGG